MNSQFDDYEKQDEATKALYDWWKVNACFTIDIDDSDVKLWKVCWDMRQENSITQAARIAELEKQFTAQEIDHQNEIHDLESQRDQLLNVIGYIAGGSQLYLDNPKWRLDEICCALIREVRGEANK